MSNKALEDTNFCSISFHTVNRDCCSVALSVGLLAHILVSSKNNREIHFDFSVRWANGRFSIPEIVKKC